MAKQSLSFFSFFSFLFFFLCISLRLCVVVLYFTKFGRIAGLKDMEPLSLFFACLVSTLMGHGSHALTLKPLLHEVISLASANISADDQTATVAVAVEGSVVTASISVEAPSWGHTLTTHTPLVEWVEVTPLIEGVDCPKLLPLSGGPEPPLDEDGMGCQGKLDMPCVSIAVLLMTDS